MPLVGAWFKVWIYLGIVFGWTMGARPRFDTSTDMGLVLIPADAEVDSVIFRLRATDQDADFPLIFEITATITPVVRIDNLPCTLYNKVCQANVILTKRLIPGRLHDFAVRVRDSKGDSNSMQATISVTNATTQRDKIFPHIPSLIMVPEDTKPGKELDYLLVRANSWSGKPVYIELWQPKELFTIRQRQTPSQTRGVITLIGELDFETQSMYTLTMYATDPYSEPGKDTRNIAGLNVVVVVQDVQDVPPIFTLAPPLTRLNNSVQPGEVILRVHAEDGDKGVPREIAYGLVSEGNPFTPFFNISETTGEIVLARPLEELTQITHVGAPVVLSVVAEEIRRTREEPPAQATVVEVGLLLGEPGNSPPYFESDTYVAVIEENLEPGTIITFSDQYSTRVRDEDIGKAGVFALKLENNNGTFEITPTVAERTADFIITVRDNTFIDYETYKSLIFKIVAQEVGPATNLSTSVPVMIYLRDVNDNPPVFEQDSYEVTLSENITAGTRVIQVHATDKDTGDFGRIQYTRIIGQGSEAFTIDSDTGLITVAMGSSLDREIASKLQLSVEARDENGKGNRGIVPLIVNLLDVNDNVPTFEKSVYVFLLNSDLTNFTAPAVIKATDADAEPPNNVIRYEIIHGNYENKFYLNEITGELILRSPITKVRRKKQSANERLASKPRKELHQDDHRDRIVKVNRTVITTTMRSLEMSKSTVRSPTKGELLRKIREAVKIRKKRAGDDALYTLTARAYDLGVPHLSSLTQISIISGVAGEDRIVTFVLPEEHPDPIKTAKTLATITGAKVTVQEIRPYVTTNDTSNMPTDAKKSIVVALVEKSTAFVDVEKIRETLAANGVGIINASVMMSDSTGKTTSITNITNTATNVHNEEVTVYKAENKLLLWLLIILGLLMLLAIAALIICCICPGCPFYMAPRKRRVQSSETLIVRSDGRPKRHLHRKQPTIVHVTNNQERKQAWSADPTRRNWQFNRRNVKNCGLASLPGDVAYVSAHANDTRINVESFGHHHDLQDYDPSGRISRQDRMYVEDIESLKMRDYHLERDSPLHEMDRRGSDHLHQDYRYEQQDMEDERTVREQHFYREGNAEILRLVTRGQVEDNVIHHHGTTVIVDGKDILLKRFMEDQKMRQEASIHDFEAARSIESTQRIRESSHPQPEIILIPQTLNIGQHVDESGPAVQRLLIDRIDFEDTPKEKISHISDIQGRQESTMLGVASESIERPTMVNKDHTQSVNVQSYSFHDMELARQNALLTRLLLERETKASGPVMADSTSYLETQSLPGQVAIATQTDRTAATQTERQVRSRSDNDDSEDESRVRKKMKTKKRYESDSKRTRTLWMKSPIEEEGGSPCFDKRLSILRKRVKEVKDGRKITIEPEVLREISDSLDDNGSSGKGDEKETKTYERSTEETSIRYEVLNEEDNGSPSSTEMYKGMNEKEKKTEMNNTESASPEFNEKSEKYTEKQPSSPKKETKKSQKKAESKPTFRILEREITLLTKKLSKLGEKKTQESTGSDSAHQEKASSTKKSSKKDTDQKTSKTSRTKVSAEPIPSTSKTTVESTGSQRKEGSMTKLRQKLKYQHAQVMSTGSSEFEDVHERSRKEISESNKETVKEKHPIGIHAKVKRQLQVEQKKDIVALKDQESDRQRELSKSESKFGKLDKSINRSQKTASTLQKESLSEELSTSTSSDRMESKKELGPRRGFDKKRSTSSSDNVSRQAGQRKSRKIRVHQTAEKTLGKASDVKDSVKEDAERYRTSTDEKSVKKKLGKIHVDEKKKISSVKSESDNTKENDRVVSLREVLKDFVGFGRNKRGTSEEQAFSDNFEDVPSERVTSPHAADSTSIEQMVIDRLETKSSKEAIKRDSEKETKRGEALKESDKGTGQKADVIETSRKDIEKDTKTIVDKDKESLKAQIVEPLVDKSSAVEEHVEKLQEEIYKSHILDKESKNEIATTSSVSIVDKILPESAITSSTSVDVINEQVPLKDNGDITGSRDEMEAAKKEDEATVKIDTEKFMDTVKRDSLSGDDNKLVSKLEDSEKRKQLVEEDKKVTKDVIEFVDKVSQIALPKQAGEVIKETKVKSSLLEGGEDKDVKKDEKDASKLMAKDTNSFKDATKMIETVLELASRRSSPQESDKEKLESSEKTLEINGKGEVHADALGITSIKVKSNGEGDSIRVSAEVHKAEVTESRSTDESKRTAMGLQDKEKIDTSVLEEDTRDVIKEEPKLREAVKTSSAKDGLEHLEIKETEMATEKDKHVENVQSNVVHMSDGSSENIQDAKSKKEEPMISPSDKADIVPDIASCANIEEKEDKSIEKKQDKNIEEKQEKSIEEKQKVETTSIQLPKDIEIHQPIKQSETSKDETTNLTFEKDVETHEKEKVEKADATKTVQPSSESESSTSKTDESVLTEKEQEEVKPMEEPKDVKVEKSSSDPIIVEKPSNPPTPVESHDLSIVEEDSKEQAGMTATDSKEARESIESTKIEQGQQLKIDEKAEVKKDEKKTPQDLILSSSRDKDDVRDKTTTIEAKKDEQEERVSPEGSKGKPSKRDEFEERADETRVPPGEKFAKDAIDKGESREEGMEEYKNVSPTIFTSIIDTLDDSDESDSSSDVSRKTTLTTRPYHTPRHRARDVTEKENLPIEATKMESVSDFEDMTVENMEDEKERQESLKNILEVPSTISPVSIKKIDSTTVGKDIEVDKKSKDTELHESVKKKHSTAMGKDIEVDKKSKDGALHETMKKKSSTTMGKDTEVDKKSKDGTLYESMKKKSSTTMDKDTEVNKKLKDAPKRIKDTLTSSTAQSQKRQSGSEKTTDTEGSENTKPTKVKADSKRQTQGKLDETKDKPSESDKSTESDKQVKKLDKDIRGSKRYSERPRVAVRRDKKDPLEEGSEVKKDPSPDKAPRPSKRRPSKVGIQPEKKENVKERTDKETEKTKVTSRKTEDDQEKRSKSKKSPSNGEKSSSPSKTSEVESGKTRSKYMAWYTQKREEMEKKREVKKVEEEEDQDQLPRWLKRSLAHRRSIPEEKKKTPEMTPRTRRKVKPLVNVESEQLKAIVRQGRKLRKAEGGRYEDPPIQIFASTPPAPDQQPYRHHLFQHSEYKYEKIPPPFYLHPPPAPHPSPQLSPEHFDPQRSMEFAKSQEDLDSGITVTMPTGTKLRHQQLLEKKSVFDIAYSEAVPPYLRADSTTPPS